jgi:hypothetical protein
MTERWGWQPLAWSQNELPSWRWEKAPTGLLTRRQMRDAGLAPGGADPVGQLIFNRGRREVRALLWDRSDLTTKRTASPAQLVAVGKALAARRWCPSCERDVGYCISTALGACVTCAFPDLAHSTEESRDAA